jgi:beta-glucosidase-like glycosyl hydrolase/CubicO group peptidase (beta-lactamase class C family)
MRESSLLDRLTAAVIVTCVVAVPAWMALEFSGRGTGGGAPETRDHYEEYLEGTGAWANASLKRLTLEQKVSQLFASFAYGVYTSADDPAYKRLVDLVERFEVGGIVFFQGDPYSQLLLANELQAQAPLPLLMAQDMEAGAGMRLTRTTHFPSAMALGATRNANLAYAAGFATAREARALGIDQVYAPVADINSNALNPVINVRSFGERPELVSDMVKAFTFGLQDAKVIATAKHFPGHGDTATDSHSDLPVLAFDRARLDSVELVPFRGVRDAGIMSIMMGHLALPQIEPDVRVPATLAPTVVTSLLRGDLGFKGLIVSDAMRMTSITKHFGTGEAAVRAIEAGVDVLVLSQDEYAARSAIVKAVESGRLTEARIDESALRILQAKEWLGLHRDRNTDPVEARRIVASQQHTTLAETIARASLTLLRNQGPLVPFARPPATIASIALNDSDEPDPGEAFQRALAQTSPGRVVRRMLDRRSTEAEINEALALAAQAEVVVVPAYLPVRSGSNRIHLLPSLQRVLDTLIARRVPVVVISFGSPYLVQSLPAQPEVYVAAYSHSEASQKTAVQALFGQSGFSGKLPITIPGLYAYGSGLETAQRATRPAAPEEVGMSGQKIASIDSLLRAAIADRAFPGAAVAIGRDQALVKLAGYGYFTYDSETPVTPESLFDLASMTKVVVTTTAAMKLFEQGKLDLDAPVARFVPEFGANGKAEIRIRDLLTHTSGLIPFRPFHEMGILTRDAVLSHIMSESTLYPVGSEMRYSDFNMIVLAVAIERITGEPFGTYVRRTVLQPLGMPKTTFRPSGGAGIDPTIVPTEVDQTFRKRLVQGEVHDETAYILGGTAGHAGLFSNAEELTRFAFMMMNEGMIDGVSFLKPETIRLFTTAVDATKHTRALGWDTRSPEGYSSAGTLMGPRSYGHTGFTGTSIWIDPDARLFVILLTNRVYPTRDNSKHTKVRSDIADLAFRAIVGPPQPILPSITHE